jgi:hypothetical protein
MHVKYLSWEGPGVLMLGDGKTRHAYERRGAANSAPPHVIFRGTVPDCDALREAQIFPDEIVVDEGDGHTYRYRGI